MMPNSSGSGYRKVEPGQVWELGRHRLYVGDALAANHYPPGGVDLVLTDPPFEMPASQQIQACKRAANAWIVAGCGAQYARLASCPGVRFWWEVVCLRSQPRSLQGWQGPHLLHWGNAFLSKSGAEHPFDRSLAAGRFGARGYFPSVLGPYQGEVSTHGKPLGWALDLLACCHVRTLADPFAGSGTVLIACEKLSLSCWASEKDFASCELLLARWERATSQKARLLSVH